MHIILRLLATSIKKNTEMRWDTKWTAKCIHDAQEFIASNALRSETEHVVTNSRWCLPKHDKNDTHLLHDKTEHTPRAFMMLIMILMGCRHAIQNRIIAECKCICTLLWRRWRQHNRDQPFAIIHPFPRHMKVIMIDVFAWSCGYRSSPVNQPFTNSNNPRVEYFSYRILFRLAVIAFVYSHVCPVQRSAKKCDSHFRHECYKVSK